MELIKPNPRDEPDKQRKDAEFAAAVFGADMDMVGGNTQSESFIGLSDVKHCGKMRALEKLMHSWTSRGDKILLFSYSVRYYASTRDGFSLIHPFFVLKFEIFCQNVGHIGEVPYSERVLLLKARWFYSR